MHAPFEGVQYQACRERSRAIKPLIDELPIFSCWGRWRLTKSLRKILERGMAEIKGFRCIDSDEKSRQPGKDSLNPFRSKKDAEAHNYILPLRAEPI